MPAQAAPLLSIRVQSGPNGSAHIVLVFNGQVPPYSLYGNGSPDVSILLTDTQQSQQNSSTINGTGNLRSVTLDNVGSNLSLGLHLGAAATVRVLQGTGPTLIVEVPNAQASPSPQPFSYGATPSPAPSVVSGAGQVVEVVRLKYADVSEIIGVLIQGQSIPSNDTFSAQPSSFGASGLEGGNYGGTGTAFTTNVQATTAAPGQALTGTGGSLGERITDNIAVDRRLNAIILTGTPAQIAPIEEMIAQLDVPLQSVLLETEVVELSETGAKDLGIDFTSSGGPSATATYSTKNLGPPTVTVNMQAALYAAIQKGEGRVLAKPRIVAQSGSEASILTGDALPIITSIISPGVNAVSQQVQYINVGVDLQIEPRITPDGFVTTHVYSEVSSVTGYTQNYPTISQRQAETIATVKDGQSFIIGGLLQQTELNNLSKVPGLGDLPLVGGFFRVRHDSSTETNLYIVVTPHIITPAPDDPTNRLAMIDGLFVQ